MHIRLWICHLDGGAEATHNYVKSFLMSAEGLLATAGRLGFLDFSGALSAFTPFSDLINGRFSGVRFIQVPITRRQDVSMPVDQSGT